MAYAVAPLLCALLFLFSHGSALSRENLQITLYVDPAVGDGPSRNSIFSVGAGGFGSIYMRDRPMLDGLGRKANIVGRMMDTNFRTSVTAPSKNIWSISLNLVFDDASRYATVRLTAFFSLSLFANRTATYSLCFYLFCILDLSEIKLYKL